jgi:hypothetical protein
MVSIFTAATLFRWQVNQLNHDSGPLSATARDERTVIGRRARVTAEQAISLCLVDSSAAIQVGDAADAAGCQRPGLASLG